MDARVFQYLRRTCHDNFHRRVLLVNASFMLCEFLLFPLQSIHPYNMKQKRYQNATFECFGLMPLHSVFYRSGNSYRNSVVSLCNTVLHLIFEFFSVSLAKQKEVRYNMTRRTETVIFQRGCDLGFYRLRD